MMKYDNVASVPRERKSVPILGLDTSTPDDLVEDGKCSDLHNLRYKDGAWRAVHSFTEKYELPSSLSSARILYQHPAVGDSKYIIEIPSKSGKYFLYDAEKPSTSPTLIFSAASYVPTAHFGNVLICTKTDKTNEDQTPRYFVYKDGSYMEWSRPDYARTTLSNYTYKPMLPTSACRGNSDIHEWGSWEDYRRVHDKTFIAFWYALHNITQDVPLTGVEDEGYWHGELLLFTTYTMADGTQLSPSPLHLVKSHKAAVIPDGATRSIAISKDPTWIYRKNKSEADVEAEASQDTFLGIAIAREDGLTIDIGTDNSLLSCIADVNIKHSLTTEQKAIVTGVSVWVTRVNPAYALPADYSVSADPISPSSRRNSNASSFVDFYADNDLANQPFYLLREIALEEFDSSNEITISLRKGSLNNAIHNKVYVPNNDIHEIAASVSLDYNNRLHRGDVTLKLFKGYDLSELASSSNLWGYVHTSVDIDNSKHTIKEAFRHDSKFVKKSNIPFSHIVSYPDYRATEIKTTPYAPIVLKPATANNFAWQHAPHTELEKFPLFPYTPLVGSTQPSINDNRYVKKENTLSVSAANNCFNMPFENTYSFGSAENTILAIQSAALEVADEKTGDLPLIVFTTQGVYALRAGSQTLYANSALINYDVIINHNTLAVNGGILYITERGVHMLVGRESTLISSPIHDINGNPPLYFLRNCKMVLSPQYDEVLFINVDEGGDTAYIYNLAAGYWSTRSLVGDNTTRGDLLNNADYVDSSTIYDLKDEQKRGDMPAMLTTRPIKLGDVEYKRVETLIPRMSSGEYAWNIRVDAARVEPNTWTLLRQTDSKACPFSPVILRRTPYSAKYFKFRIESVGEGFAITNIDIEWYKRLRRRMR